MEIDLTLLQEVSNEVFEILTEHNFPHLCPKRDGKINKMHICIGRHPTAPSHTKKINHVCFNHITSPTRQIMHEQTQAWMHKIYTYTKHLRKCKTQANAQVNTHTHTHATLLPPSLKKPISADTVIWSTSSVYRSIRCWFAHYLHFLTNTNSSISATSQLKWKYLHSWHTADIWNERKEREIHPERHPGKDG